jgi:hypothetical protein
MSDLDRFSAALDRCESFEGAYDLAGSLYDLALSLTGQVEQLTADLAAAKLPHDDRFVAVPRERWRAMVAECDETRAEAKRLADESAKHAGWAARDLGIIYRLERERDEALAALEQERLANVGLNDLVGKLGVLGDGLQQELAAAQIPDGVTPTKFMVSVLPVDHPKYRYYALNVMTDIHGNWFVERFQEWLSVADWSWSFTRGHESRFETRDEALAAALAAAPHVEVNGRTAAQVLGEGGDGA